MKKLSASLSLLVCCVIACSAHAYAMSISPTDLVGNWNVTGPINNAKEYPLAVAQNNSYFAPYMYMNNGVLVMKTPVNGATTSGSSYPRTELREMKGSSKASWSDKSSANTMTVKEAIVHEPVVKPQVVSAQIHDSSDDVIEVYLNGNKLYTKYDDDKKLALMDSNYVLGTPFTVVLSASKGKITVTYNGVQKLSTSKSESGLYFKAGSYCQSNLSKGDKSSAYCEVDLYSVAVQH